ncbi:MULTISPECIES: amidohydrolase [unclassified Acidocella]|uniref:amidohydrolase family protein n=1 Tax=unclassified Acidocella TaxID=2648610 RepID=UPI00034C104C|nr:MULTISPECIES: amidohydrolase family protein [unclassified Acidocella]WBO58912.1 amidohydrolase family protein [Acidocella sp. MX-AZ03]
MRFVHGVDAHAHVFHRGLKLAEGRRYAPMADATLADYLAFLDRMGMAQGVLVQPSFLGVDNSYLLDCLVQSQGRLRGVAVIPEVTPASALSALFAAGVRAVRFNLIGRALPDFRSAGWRAQLQRLAGAGLHAEIQCRGEDALALLTALLETLPHVVLDHYGLPPGGEPDHAVVRQILKLAQTGRVYVKISAPYRFLPPGAAVRTLLRAYWKAFGAARLLWGSDWPHTQFENRADPRRSLDEICDAVGADSAALAALTATTARALYGFEPPGLA